MVMKAGKYHTFSFCCRNVWNTICSLNSMLCHSVYDICRFRRLFQRFFPAVLKMIPIEGLLTLPFVILLGMIDRFVLTFSPKEIIYDSSIMIIWALLQRFSASYFAMSTSSERSPTFHCQDLLDCENGSPQVWHVTLHLREEVSCAPQPLPTTSRPFFCIVGRWTHTTNEKRQIWVKD